jgi:hypothetical protein
VCKFIIARAAAAVAETWACEQLAAMRDFLSYLFFVYVLVVPTTKIFTDTSNTARTIMVGRKRRVEALVDFEN